MTVTEERAAIGETVGILYRSRPAPGGVRRASHVGACRAMIAACRWCDDRTDGAERWDGVKWRDSRRYAAVSAALDLGH